MHDVENEEPRKELEAYKRKLLRDPLDPTDNYDPLNYRRHAHDLSLLDIRQHLTKAVTERKASALPLAIQVFNRIQEKAVKQTKLNNYAEVDDNEEV